MKKILYMISAFFIALVMGVTQNVGASVVNDIDNEYVTVVYGTADEIGIDTMTINDTSYIGKFVFSTSADFHLWLDGEDLYILFENFSGVTISESQDVRLYNEENTIELSSLTAGSDGTTTHPVEDRAYKVTFKNDGIYWLRGPDDGAFSQLEIEIDTPSIVTSIFDSLSEMVLGFVALFVLLFGTGSTLFYDEGLTPISILVLIPLGLGFGFYGIKFIFKMLRLGR
jgi:hypothetical protein